MGIEVKKAMFCLELEFDENFTEEDISKLLADIGNDLQTKGCSYEVNEGERDVTLKIDITDSALDQIQRFFE